MEKKLLHTAGLCNSGVMWSWRWVESSKGNWMRDDFVTGGGRRVRFFEMETRLGKRTIEESDDEEWQTSKNCGNKKRQMKEKEKEKDNDNEKEREEKVDSKESSKEKEKEEEYFEPSTCMRNVGIAQVTSLRIAKEHPS